MQLTIYFDIAAVLVCVILLFSLIMRKLTRGINNVFFLSLVSLIGLSGILDIVDQLYGPVLPANEYTVVAQAMLGYLYFFIRNFTTPFYILYIASVIGIRYKFREKKILEVLLWGPYIIDVIVLMLNPWNSMVFGFDATGHYYRGPLMMVLYVVAFYYLVFGFFIAVKRRKVLSGMKSLILIMYLPIVGAAVLVQLFEATWRIEIFASAFMSVLVALGVQRPEENLDQVVNTQSHNAYLIDTKKFFTTRSPFCSLYISIINHGSLRQNLGIEHYSDMLRNVSEKLTRICKIMDISPDIYFLDRGVFVILVDDKYREVLMDAGRLIMAYMQEPIKINEQEVKVDIKVVLVNVPSDISDYDMFVNIAHTFKYSLPDKNVPLRLFDYVFTKDYLLKANLDSIIARAINDSNLKMYYQPIYSVHDGKFRSAEALIRLIDKEYGFVSPAVFIPAAEKSGAIHRIGEFVFDDVFKFIAGREIKKYGVDYIEINLSVAQCIDISLLNKVGAYMKKHKIYSASVNIEITETAVDYDSSITMKNINGLREMGFSFSLDDFGTGYSNVSRIAGLPIDIVKIDKSLVDEVDNPQMWTVIEKTVSMLKKLDKEILVEGIEDKNALDKFVSIGVDFVQGYYFSKPLPEDDYIEFLKRENFKDDTSGNSFI